MNKPDLSKFKIKNTKKLAPIIGGAIFLLAAAYIGTNYYLAQKELSAYKNISDVNALKEKNDLIKTLSKLVLLPEDEEPTIATVTDAFRLRGQKFFENAKNGDKVIIYTNAQRAVLFRPDIKKVIEAAPVNIGDLGAVTREVADASESTSSNFVLGENEQMEPAKVAIYNGTLSVSGLANDLSDILTEKFSKSRLTVDIVANAEDTYEETLVINITGIHNELNEELVRLLNAEKMDKLEDVNFPDVDIIIIAGKDLNLDKLD